MKSDKNQRRSAPLLALTALALMGTFLAGCNSSLERDAERANERTREDVRGFRDFLYDRGITINTRLPDR